MPARKAPERTGAPWKRSVAVPLLGLALGLAGLYLVAGGRVFEIETYRVRNPSASIMALSGIAFLAEWFGTDAVRIWLLCRRQGIPLPFRSAVLVHLAAMFVGAVTPGNAGVGPVTAVALQRLGAPLGKGIGVALQVFVLDMIYFAWAVPLSLGYLVYSDALQLPPRARIAVFATVALAMAGAAVLTRRPRLVVRVILTAARWPLLRRSAPRMRQTARDYYRSARSFKGMPVPAWLALNLLTAAGWFSGFVLFWLLLKLYGVDADLLATLALLNGVTLVSHVVPTPGGSGFMEAALGLGVGASAGGAAGALLVWRLASYYVIFLLGPPASWLLHLSEPVAARGETRRDG